MTFALIGFLSGILLGLRQDVLILMPAILGGWLLVVAVGFVAGEHTKSILIALVVVAAALQVGFIAGIVCQWVMGLLRSPGRRRLLTTSG